MQKIKHCYSCKLNLPVEFFSKNRGRKDGFQSSCKKCQTKKNREYYKKNKKRCIQVISTNKRIRALKNYMKVLTRYFNKPCVDCKTMYHPASMVFDHMRNKNDGVGTLIRDGHSWSVVKREIDKCEVRCQNCHFLKTFREHKHWNEISDSIEFYYNAIKNIDNIEKNGNFKEKNAYKELKGKATSYFKKIILSQIKIYEKNKKDKIYAISK